MKGPLTASEVAGLRSEMQQAREVCNSLSQVTVLSAKVKDLQRCIEATHVFLHKTYKNKGARKTCSSQSDKIVRLKQQLASSQEEVRLLKQLEAVQTELADAKKEIRRKVHNTIMELKGKIRVFCRVRHALKSDPGFGTSTEVFSCPTSTELKGRAIDLTNDNGQKLSFTFEKLPQTKLKTPAPSTSVKERKEAENMKPPPSAKKIKI